jgi:hypothetical protein
VTPSSIPTPNFRVRRRRNGDLIWLILDNYSFVLDARTDAAWCACDGRRTIEEMSKVVASAVGEQNERATAIVFRALEMFHRNGLVEMER